MLSGIKTARDVHNLYMFDLNPGNCLITPRIANKVQFSTTIMSDGLGATMGRISPHLLTPSAEPVTSYVRFIDFGLSVCYSLLGPDDISEMQIIAGVCVCVTMSYVILCIM